MTSGMYKAAGVTLYLVFAAYLATTVAGQSTKEGAIPVRACLPETKAIKGRDQFPRVSECGCVLDRKIRRVASSLSIGEL